MRELQISFLSDGKPQAIVKAKYLQIVNFGVDILANFSVGIPPPPLPDLYFFPQMFITLRECALMAKNVFFAIL